MVLVCNPRSLFSDGISDGGQPAEVFIVDSLANLKPMVPVDCDTDLDAEPETRESAARAVTDDALAIRHSGWSSVRRYAPSS
jgi:hypothetical protein